LKINPTVLAAIFTSSMYSNVYAHHSSAPHFDRDTEVVVTGVVTELKFVNPHAYIYFDAEQDGELVNWRCELSSASALGRRGWTETSFVVGQQITVNGAPAWREDNVCFLNQMTLSDGTVVQRNSDLTEMQDVVAANTIPQQERAKFLASGQSNIEGAWVTRSFGGGSEGIRTRFTATAAGEEAVGDYDMAFDDPILRCHPVNIFNGWNHDRHINDISVEGDLIIIQYGFMDFVRTVHLGMSEHPENVQPSTGGHSIGKWEGDTLVVDTVGFEEGVLRHQSGMKHSSQMQVVERFHVDAETGYLLRDYDVKDPPYLVGEVSGQDLMSPSDAPYSPYNCVELSGENNIRQE